MSKNISGAWVCTSCGALEHQEREVLCQTCGGKGEMVYRTSVEMEQQVVRAARKLVETGYKGLTITNTDPSSNALENFIDLGAKLQRALEG